MLFISQSLTSTWESGCSTQSRPNVTKSTVA